MKLGSGAVWVCLGVMLVTPALADSPIPPKSLELVSVRSFGALCDGVNDDTSAFNTAITVAHRVYIPAGVCLVHNVRLLSDTTLFGDGEASIIRPSPQATYVFSVNADSGGTEQPQDNIHHVRISGLQFQGTAENDAFDEHRYLLNLNAVSDVTIDGVIFHGFRGDAIYLGSSNRPGLERHNTQIAVRNSRFDGINGQNRNAISVIDVEGLVIENNTFQNTTRDDMPGAIDLEPNNFAFGRINHVQIRNNHFVNIGGQSGAISMYIPLRVHTEPAQILIDGNRFDHLRASAIMLYRNKAITDATASHNVQIVDNTVNDCDRPFSLFGVRGVTLSHNRFDHCTRSALVGFALTQHQVRDIVLTDNVFAQSGSHDGACMNVFNVSTLRLHANTFSDCGTGNDSSAAITLSAGQSDNMQLTGNRFTTPKGRTHYAVRRELAHTAEVRNNRFDDNDVAPGLAIDFPLPDPLVNLTTQISRR